MSLVDDAFSKTVGVSARLGRTLMATDYASGGSRLVVVAERTWRDRYNADPSILGREIVLDGAAYRVIGVMPPGFLPTGCQREPAILASSAVRRNRAARSRT